jgi:hypothetical protein
MKPTTPDVNAILNEEIVRELLIEHEPTIAEADIINMQKICVDNPWNAAILYQMIKIILKNEQTKNSK